MAPLNRLSRLLFSVAATVVAASCATTTVTLQPSPQLAVCAPSAVALVVWAPQWRPDQKDVFAREEAAATGLKNFLAQSGCFARSELRRVPDLHQPTVRSQLATVGSVSRVVGVEVRELGPVVKLLSSAALVEGGTQAVIRVVEYSPDFAVEQRQFTVHWQSGGPGVVKGVASLPEDMQRALNAGLQPNGTQK
jgi:hypothetical protein